ncbi:unnamed protein product [Victoria cruziana]
MLIILDRPFLATVNAYINCRTGILEISFGDQKLRLNIFHAAMGPAGDKCISFAEADDDDAAHEVVMSIFRSTVADPGLDFLPGADFEAMYDSRLGFPDLDLGVDISSSHNHISIVSSLDHFLPSDLVSSHPLSFEMREADGRFDVIATTTLHRGRPHPTDFESLPPLTLDPDSSSLESLPVMELKPLPHTLKYAYLGSDDSLSVIISSVLSLQEEERLLAVLRGHKRPLGGRQLNPAMNEVVKKEIIKWLDAGIIFLILDSEWVSPVQVVPKKTELAVVENEYGEEISTKTQTGYNQVAVHPDDKEKTTFTCPFGTFAFRRMPFGLCNAPGTFKMCILSIFSDMIEDTMKVFMDDFLVYGSSFDDCLRKLKKVLIRCEEMNLELS